MANLQQFLDIDNVAQLKVIKSVFLHSIERLGPGTTHNKIKSHYLISSFNEVLTKKMFWGQKCCLNFKIYVI